VITVTLFFVYSSKIRAYAKKFDASNGNNLTKSIEKSHIWCYNIECQVINKEVYKMAVSYKKLWKLLVEHEMTKGDLAKKAGISTYTITKMGKGDSVTTDILVKICSAFECDIADIMEVIPNEKSDK